MKKPLVPPALRRSFHLRRRAWAALCTFVAVLAALLALAPPAPTTVTVLVARAALPAGTVLAPEHLASLALPPEAVPEGALLAPGDAVGRTLAGPTAARSVVTAASVSSGRRLARPGHVVVALPVTDEAIASLVGPGVRLDVLDAAGAVVASDVPVVAPPDTPGGTGLGFGASSRSVLVEVPHAVAATLSSLGATSLTVAVR